MGKKKEKADLGQLLSKLLNDLLKMGWKPFNRDKTLHIDCYDKCKGLNYKWIHLDGGFMNEESRTLRELVSIDSGLWQFVCENGMVNVPHPNKGKYPRDKLEREQYKYWDRTIGYYGEDNLDRIGYNWDKYQFRLIESSLKDESELEDFLLSNIKVEG